MKTDHQLLVTCEHATNQVPQPFADLFAGQAKYLADHYGFDPGAADLARILAAEFQAPLFLGTATRLLIDLNRSLHNPGKLFSKISQPCSDATKDAIIQQHYRPFRDGVITAVEGMIQQGSPVLHLSVHTFTAYLHGRARIAEIGLLYDPRRQEEKDCCRTLRRCLRLVRPDLRIRLNYPYLGISDGFTTALRKKLPSNQYVGFELEVNQKLLQAGSVAWAALARDIASALRHTGYPREQGNVF